MAIDLDVHGNTRPLESAVQAAVNRIRRKPIKIIVDDKGATQPLGNMKRGADEFSKSMEAANARILAFGASMAIINGVGNAFKQMVGNVIEVEKALADINVVMGLSTQKLEEFSDGLFKAAKETGQAFKIASNAAVEYARQGLGVEESLKRTRDALILTRLTGMESAEAVKALTAAMNTYGSQIDDTTQLVSKFAAVDVQFAVSAEDFADAIARTGQSAKSAGVDIDELIGIVTAAQQQTARGGKVIGNSLKTIFTRIGRTDTLNQLENLGIAVRDVEGNTLGATRILTDLANTFDHLSEAQKAQIAQTVGGVFQINILKAVLSDAAKQNGILARATDISSNATDEAIQKNDELRNTFSALATETGLALKEMSVAIGEVALAPGMEKILNTFKSFAEGANELLGEGESAGSKFANGFLAGLGNILTGPGLVVLTAVFFKLFGSAVKFTKESLTSLMGITTEAQKQKAIQTSLVTLFSQNAELGERMLRTDISRTEKEKIILGLIKAQVAEAKMLNTVAQQAASTLYRQGFGANLTPRKNKATGHIPNFASKNSTRGKREKEEARESGYSAGAIRSQALPGEGLITYNTAETIKKFPGIKETAIMPPMQSKAGEKYKTGFEEIHGFDPYEAGGLATNFGSRNQKTVPLERIRKLSQSKEVDKRQSSNLISPAQTFQSSVEQSGSKNQRTPPKERTAQADESGSKNQTSAPRDRAIEQPGSKNQKLTPKTLDQGELQVGSKNQRTPPKERTEQAVEPGSKNQTSAPQDRAVEQPGSKNQKLTPRERREDITEMGSKNQISKPQERQIQTDESGSKNQTSAPQDRAVEQPGSKNQKLTPRARREDITEMGSKNQISKPQERQVQTDESGSKNQTTPARERQVEQPGSQNQVKPIDPKAANQTQNFNTILNNKILPQAESIDGNNYKQAFEKINGFNPYVSKSIFSDTVSGMGGVGPQVAARKNIEKQDATSIEDKIIKSGSKNQTTPPEERIFEGPQKGSKNQNQEPDDRQLEIEKTGSKNQILTPKKQTEAISEIGSKNQTTETVPLERDFEMQKRGSKNQTTEPEDRRFETKEIGSKNQRKSPAFKIRPAKEFKLDQEPKNYPNPETKDGERYKMGFMSLNKNDPYRAKSKVSNFSYEDEEKEKNKPKYALGFIPNFYQGSRNQRWTPKERQPDDENIFEAMGFAGAGLVPAAAQEERSQALKAGYAPGTVKTMSMPGEGQVYYNSAEQVKTFPGMSQPAIMPPAQSRAGKVYQQEFSNQHGFDPYAAEGYIPNFNKSKSKTTKKTGPRTHLNKASAKYIGLSATNTKDKMGTLYATAGVGNSNVFVSPSGAGYQDAAKKSKGAKIDYEFYSLDDSERRKYYKTNVEDELKEDLQRASYGIMNKLLVTLSTKDQRFLAKKADVNRDLPQSKMAVAAGHIFEAAAKTILRSIGAEAAIPDSETARIDFFRNDELYRLFGVKGPKGSVGAEAKINSDTNNAKSFARKIYDLEIGGKGITKPTSKTSDLLKTKADKENFNNWVVANKGETFNGIKISLRGGDRSNMLKDPEKRSVLAQAFSNRNNAYGHIPNFAAMAISKLGGLGSSKFGLAAVINSNPYFAQLLKRHGHWQNFPPQEKTKLNKFLLKQGFTNRTLQGYGLASMHSKSIGEGISNIAAADGYIPNFANPLSDAINREKHAGVPVSQIRVDSHAALVNRGNPLGLGVTNTRDEPNGLRDVFGANGFVPNYAVGDFISGFRMNETERDSLIQSREEYKKVIKESTLREKELVKIKKQQEAALGRQKQGTSAYNRAQQRLTATSNELATVRQTQASAKRNLDATPNSTARGAAFRQRFAGSGMMMVMGASMASGYMQSGGAEKGGIAYNAGGAMQGAATGAMMGSMIAPFLGPAAPLVVAAGALYGGFKGWTEAMDQNTKALKEKERRDFATQYQSASQAFSQIVQREELTRDIESAGLTSAITAGFDPKTTVGQTLYQMGSQEARSIDLDDMLGTGWEKKYFRSSDPEKNKQKETEWRESFKKVVESYDLDKYASGERPRPKNLTNEQKGEQSKWLNTFRNTNPKDPRFENIKSLQESLYQEGSIRKQARAQAIDYFLDNEKADKFKFKFEEGGEDILFAKDQYRKLLKGETAKDVSGKERTAELSQINKKLTEQGVLEEEYNQTVRKQKEAAILQLNLQKVMIASQQAAKDAQFAIKEKFLKQNTMLDLQEKMLSGFLGEETKARIKYTKSLNKITEAYNLGTEAAKRGFKTGIIDDLSKSSGSTQQSVRQALFARMSDKEKQKYNIKEGDSSVSVYVMNEMLEKMNNKELEDFLKSIQADQTEINLILEKRNSLLDNQNSDLEKTRDSATNILDLEKAINDVINGRKDQMKEVNRELDKYIQGLGHAAKMRDLKLEGMDIEFSKGGFKTTPEKIEYEKSKSRMRIKGVREQYEEMGINRIRDLNKEYGLGMTQDQIIEASKNPSALMSESGEPVYTSARIEASRALLKTTDYAPQEAKDIGDKISQSEQRLQGFKDKKGELVFAEPNEEIVSTLEKTNKKIEEEEAALQKLKERQEDINKTLEDRSQREKELLEAQNDLNGKIQNAVHARKNENDQLNEKIKNIKEAIKAQEEEWERMTGSNRFSEGLKDGFTELENEVALMDYELTKNIPKNFANGMSSALLEAINGAKDLDEALTDAAINFLGMIQQAMMQKMAYQFVGAMGFDMKSRGGKAQESNVGLTSRRYSRGGSIPAMVSNGEYIMGREAVNRYGGAFMHSLNVSSRPPGYSNGGAAQEDPLPGSALASGHLGYKSGKKYQSLPMSGFFYSESGNVALSEDADTYAGMLQEEYRKIQEAREKARQKKAKKRQIWGMVLGTLATAAISNMFDSLGGPSDAARQAGFSKSDIASAGKNAVVAKNIKKPDSFGNVETKLFESKSAVPDGWVSTPARNPFSFGSLNPFKKDSPKPTNWSESSGMRREYFGGPIKKYASGGWISGKSGIDQIPAMLSNGEYVIRASSARQIGKPMLDKINAGKFNEGGMVGQENQNSNSSTTSAGNTNNINISVNIDSSKQVKENTQTSSDSNSAQSSGDDNSSVLAERIKQQIVAVIVEEQRPGGLLHD